MSDVQSTLRALHTVRRTPGRTKEAGAVKQTKWEYHVLIRDLVEEGASADAFAEVRRLGESGWELVSVNYLTAYVPSVEPTLVADEADVMARVRKRLNVTLARAGYVPATNGTTGAAHSGSSTGNGNGAGAAAPSPVRIDALPETRLEAWFKRPA
jgi:hypothetical protein